MTTAAVRGAAVAGAKVARGVDGMVTRKVIRRRRVRAGTTEARTLLVREARAIIMIVVPQGAAVGAARVVGSATPKVIRKPPVKAGEIATPTGPAVVAMKMRTIGALRGAATATRAAGPEMSTKAIGALLLTKDAVTEVGSATPKDILRLPVRAGKIVV